jgi:hypothetical protein
MQHRLALRRVRGADNESGRREKVLTLLDTLLLGFAGCQPANQDYQDADDYQAEISAP